MKTGTLLRVALVGGIWMNGEGIRSRPETPFAFAFGAAALELVPARRLRGVRPSFVDESAAVASIAYGTTRRKNSGKKQNRPDHYRDDED